MKLFIRILIISSIALLWLPTQTWARGLTTGEYYWDADPGQGSGTPISAADGTFDQAVENLLQSGINLPAVGNHTFNVRVKDDNGHWGPVFRTVVVVDAATTSLRQIKVTAGEYFFDTDPGAGNGSTMIAFDGAFDQAVEDITQSGINLPAVGTHTFSMRAKDAAGTWGPTFSTVIVVDAATTSLRQIKVTAGEYFFDTDPGTGNGSPMIAFDGAFDQAIEVVSQSGINLPAVGTHTFNVRAKDVAGTWGPVFSTVIVVDAATTSLRQIKVTAGEYFFDNDPGAGSASPMIAFDGAFDQAVEVVSQSGINLPAVGTHTFNVRAKDVAGTWGPVFSTVIVVDASSTTLRQIKVVAGEYFFDTDPGVGNGTAMLAFDGTFNSAIEDVIGGNIPAPVVAGMHVLNIRAKDVAGNWGPVFGIMVNIDTTISAYNTDITGSTTICSNHLAGLAYSTPLTAGNLYTWDITGGTITAGTGTNSVTVTWNASGPYKLKVTECGSGGSPCSADSIIPTINAVPTSSVTATICQGQSYGGHIQTGVFTDTLASAATNGCDSIRTVNLTVIPTVVPNVTISANPSGAICNGTSVTFTANITNGGSSPTYQWFVNGASAGSGATLTRSNLANNDVVKVVLTSNASCPSPATDTDMVTMTVNPLVTPSVTFSFNPNGVSCQGTNITFTASPTNGGSSPTYQWYVNNNPVGTGVSYTSSTINNGDHVYVSMTSSATCPSPATVSSSTVTMSVTGVVTPSISISANPSGAICSGTSVTFSANITNGGTSPSYQWYVNGTAAGTGSTLTRSNLNNGDSVRCVLTSNVGCASVNSVSSNTINMSVSSSVTPSVTIAANPSGAICSGTSVTFTPTPSGGGNAPSYQWYVNGTNAGTGATLTRSNLNNGDSVRCVLTSSSACASPTSASSNTITMVVSGTVAPSITIAASPSGAICSGTSVTFTATPSGGGNTPSYQWYVNGASAGTGATLTRSNLNNGDSVRCVLTSSSACASPSSASSNTINMVVNSTVVPSVSIAANPSGAICSGTSVTFTATPTNGGNTPTYQWYVNGVSAGAGSTLTRSNLNNGDSVRCVLTSNATCVSPAAVSSNTINMTINGTLVPSVAVAANPSGAICPGTSVTFTATPTNGGTTPAYQWYVNSTVVGTGATYTNSSLNNHDTIRVVLTSNNACASPTTATSTPLVMNVSGNIVPTVAISASPSGSVCSGTNIVFTATPSGGGSNPSYVWYVNSSVYGSGASINSNTLNDHDTVKVVMTSNAGCASPNTAKDSVTVSIGSTAQTGVSINVSPNGPVCAGSTVTYTANATNGGTPTYQWQVNGNNVATGSSYVTDSLHDGDVVKVTMQSSLPCASPTSISSTVTASVLPIPRDTVTTTICQGQNYAGHTATGTYMDTITVSGGCDSIHVINLTVNPLTQFAISQTICSGASFGGHTSTGTYVDTIHVSGGCDSIRTLTLTVLPQIGFSRNVTICQGDSYFAGGANQTTAGSYYDTLTAANGCDSVVTTVLSVNPSPAVPAITQNGFVLSTDTAGITGYQWYLGNAQLPGANSSQYTAAANGVYHVVVTNAIGCSTASDTIVVIGVGVDEVSPFGNITLFPNPTDGRVTLLLPSLPNNDGFTIEVLNVLGERVYPPVTSTNSQVQLDLHQMSAGLYLVRVTHGKYTWNGKVIKAD